MRASDILERYKPARKTISILLDGSAQTEIDRLQRELKKAVRTEKTDGLKSQVNQLRETIKDAEQSADDASVTFTLQAIPGKDFDDLKRVHPPTEDQWERFREQQKQNPLFASPPDVEYETFLPDLIGLSVCEVDGQPVEWTVDDGRQLWAELHDGARADLSDAAWGVNGQRSARPLSAPATGQTSNSGSGSTTPANTESPTPSTTEGS